MAGNKVNSKTKTKDDKGKSNRNSSPADEESEELDFSVLRKSIHTSITGFAQARKVFDLATEELKGLLTSECDILYECKVCRNIFRSLANFISHKRMYCKERFDTSVHGHFVRTLSVASEISRIKKLEELYNESLKDEDLITLNQKEIDDRIPLTKDLTEIIERLSSVKGKQLHQVENPEVILQKIPKSNVAVFQNIRNNDESRTDLMRAQVQELNAIMSRENGLLNSDGTVEIHSSLPLKKAREPESIIQISDDDDNNEGDILKCKICDLQFSTQKTLKFHMKYKHLESRLVYPCPDCLEIFSTSWSVYRHLFKVHRKTAAQIRRLRESIQTKAFRMNNPPAFYEKRKNNAKNTTPQKITEEQRLDQENQAWMDNLEGDGEVPRCGGCGRTFERRAALAAHTHTCQPRSRALARRPPDSRKIEIQIRKDYNKASSTLILPLKIADLTDKKQVSDPVPDQSKMVQDKEKEPVEEAKSKEKMPDKSSESLLSKQSTDESQNNKNKVNESKNTVNLPFARQTELSNFNALSKQCQSDIEMEKLQCKKCDNKFTKVADLYDHMAEHYKWLRYACKLCNYKHYSFEKLPEHVKVVHKLKGDTDFYYSTVKAIDGIEALQLSECCKDTSEASDNSPESRRPSRCSSDSSRLSDDSSSSSTRVEGTRKRKMKNNKNTAKKKKEAVVTEDTDVFKDSETSNDMLDDNESPPLKVFEENSSDIDEVEEKATKKIDEKSTTTISTRRPIRKRTNKKNEDFEYDLSNLLKMEAQGYRDSQSVVTTKSLPTKKKSPVENQSNTDINKDYCGALVVLSKRAVSTSLAHLKYPYYPNNETRTSNVFLRPLLPKVARVERVSPKKDADVSIPNKILKQSDLNPPNPEKEVKTSTNTSQEKPKQQDENTKTPEKEVKEPNSPSEVNAKPASIISESPIATKLSVPTVVPLKLRRQSLDLIKNPLIKKNITDFSKAGMKTKILVIKPINRNKEGGKSINSPLKFQTIKLKDPMKSSSSSTEKQSDQVRVVQVPNVDCAKLPVTSASIVKNDTNLLKPKVVDTGIISNETASSEKIPEIIPEKGKSNEDISNINNSPPCLNTEIEPSHTENLNRTEEQKLSEELLPGEDKS